MNSMHDLQKHQNEERAIFEALREQSKESYKEDTDAIFLMHLDVPDAIMKKLRAH